MLSFKYLQVIQVAISSRQKYGCRDGRKSGLACRFGSLIHRVNDGDELDRQASMGRTNPRKRQD